MLLMPLHGALFIVYLAVIVVKVFAFVDAMTRSERSFVAADKQTKQFWLVVLGLAVLTSWLGFLSLVGLVAALVYLADVRPAVAGR